VTELENNQQKFRNGWREWVEFLLPLKFGHYDDGKTRKEVIL